MAGSFCFSIGAVYDKAQDIGLADRRTPAAICWFLVTDINLISEEYCTFILSCMMKCHFWKGESTFSFVLVKLEDLNSDQLSPGYPARPVGIDRITYSTVS